MKFVIQRVLQGSVKVNEKIVGEIGPGLVVLIGFTHSDKKENLKFAANKLLTMRLWDDNKGTRWKECLKDKNYSLLIVSQFTLYSFFKGNKPDFHYSMDPKNAEALYDEFLKILKQIYNPEKIQSGLFGEMMQVSLINDGPVTINWEYPELPEKDSNKGNSKEMILEKENVENKNQNKKKNGNSNNTNNTNNVKDAFENNLQNSYLAEEIKNVNLNNDINKNKDKENLNLIVLPD